MAAQERRVTGVEREALDDTLRLDDVNFRPLLIVLNAPALREFLTSRQHLRRWWRSADVGIQVRTPRRRPAHRGFKHPILTGVEKNVEILPYSLFYRRVGSSER